MRELSDMLRQGLMLWSTSSTVVLRSASPEESRYVSVTGVECGASSFDRLRGEAPRSGGWLPGLPTRTAMQWSR